MRGSVPVVQRFDCGIELGGRNFDAVTEKTRRVSPVGVLIDFEYYAHGRCSLSFPRDVLGLYDIHPVDVNIGSYSWNLTPASPRPANQRAGRCRIRMPAADFHVISRFVTWPTDLHLTEQMCVAPADCNFFRTVAQRQRDAPHQVVVCGYNLMRVHHGAAMYLPEMHLIELADQLF